MDCVANDFYNALKELYQNPAGCFNQLKISPEQPFIIFGESYGGKYAPAIGERIIREAQDKAGFLKGLKGVAIGDGFTHPGAIFSQVGEFAYNFHDTFDKGLDLIVDFAGGVNVYDITKYHDYPILLIDEYLGNLNNQKLYGLRSDIKYGAQAGNVYEAMYVDFMMPYVQLVEELLRRNIKVMVYTGQNDLIV